MFIYNFMTQNLLKVNVPQMATDLLMNSYFILIYYFIRVLIFTIFFLSTCIISSGDICASMLHGSTACPWGLVLK